MDVVALAAFVSKLQNHVQEAATALKVANDNLVPDSTPADVELNRVLLEVDTIATNLEQLVFHVEDGLRDDVMPDHVGLGDNSSAAVEEEASGSNDIDDDDVH